MGHEALTLPTGNEKRRFLGTIIFLGIGWTALYLLRLQWASIEEIFWLTLLYIFCCFPTVLFLSEHKFQIPFMPMWGLGYFMMFGMPMLSRNKQGDFKFIANTDVIDALRLATLGAFLCLLAFYSPLGNWVERLTPHLKAPWNPKRAPLMGVLLCIIGLSFNYLEKTSVPSLLWNQLLFLGAQLGIIGMLTLFLLQLRGQLNFFLRLFLWGIVLPVEYLMGLGTGAVYNALMTIAPLLFCYAAEKRRIPFLTLFFIFLVCFVPFSGLKGEYRSMAWYGQTGDVAITNSPLQRGIAFIQVVTRRLGEGGLEAYTIATESAQTRVSHLDVLITVMQSTPSSIPFWGGETYQTLLWAFIPRFLFPNKPEKTLGQAFGHRYGFLAEEDYWTSINLPHQVVEMYINFGTSGVLIGMMFLGLVYRGLTTMVGRPDAGERSLIVGCTVLSGLLTLDSDLSLVMGGLVYLLPIMYLATRGFKANPSSVV